MASPGGNPNANPNNLNSPFDIWMLFSPPHNQSPPMASPAGNPNLNLNNPNLPFDTGMPLIPPHNQPPLMASPARNPSLNPSNPNLPFDIDVPVNPTHNPMPTTASMYPGAAGPSWLSSPDFYPRATHTFHHGPYLHYMQDPHPPMPRPAISFQMSNPVANPAGPYAQDLQTPMPRPAISFQMPNPGANSNRSGNPGGPYLHYAQDLQNSMPRSVTNFPSSSPHTNPNSSVSSVNKPTHKEGAPNGRQNNSTSNSHVISISDSESESEGFFEETPTYSKSNGKASSSSLKTGGKASSFSEGEAGKGGKGFSAGKGGKGSTSNAKPGKSDAELKLELDMPPNSRILMNCEAAEMLQQIHEHMAILSEDPKIKIPESFDKAFQYAKEGNHFTTAKSVKQILDPLKKYGVNDGEICMIANIGPETIEEVYALVPSLKATKSINEGLITEALAALTNIKASK